MASSLWSIRCLFAGWSAGWLAAGMKSDRVIVVCSILLAIVYFYAIEQIPVRDIGDPLGPKAIPRILGVFLLVTAGMLMLEMRLTRTKFPIPEEGEAAPEGWRHYLVVGAVVLLTLLYFVVFERLGYALATTVYLYALMAYFNCGRWKTNMLTATLFSFVSYLLFTKLFGAQLAPGILPF